MCGGGGGGVKDWVPYCIPRRCGLDMKLRDRDGKLCIAQ